jgi:hypothetical protein
MTNDSTKVCASPGIVLTAAAGIKGLLAGSPINVSASELIAYDQESGFTRLMLVGRKVLHVLEGTDQIDRMVRSAATR